MGRRSHDQGLIITCTGATDVGGGVVQYVIYILRADSKGADAPADTQDNFSRAVEIGRIGNLEEIISYRGGVDPQVRTYDQINEYRLRWYGWDEGYKYRAWTYAVDRAGNIEIWDGTGNTIDTEVLSDTKPPQFVAFSASGVRIPNNCVRRSDLHPWKATKPVSPSRIFTIKFDVEESGIGVGTLNTLTDPSKNWTPDAHIDKVLVDASGTEFSITDNGATTLTVSGTPANGEYTINGVSPGWVTDALKYCWLVFYSSDGDNPSYVYFARIDANATGGTPSKDTVTVLCDASNPVYQLEYATKKMEAITAIADVIDDSPAQWSEGYVAVLGVPNKSTQAGANTSPVPLTCGIGTMTVQYPGVDPAVADLDHYEVGRYVFNTKEPNQPGHYDYQVILRIEDTEFTDYNLVWNRTWLKKWESGDDFDDSSEIFSDGLYMITPVDVYGNEGYPVVAYNFENLDGFFPATGTPPANITGIAAESDDDGNIDIRWQEVADDDLRGYQVRRRRGEYSGSGDDTDPQYYTWGTWETIAADDLATFPPGDGYAREYVDRNLEPFSTLARPEKVAYQYQVRATDYSGNTAAWVGHGTGTGQVIKAVDDVVSTTGSSMVLKGDLGAIILEIQQPTDDKSVRVHIYRSVHDNSSYEPEPFKIVDLPINAGTLYTQDEIPPTNEAWLIYYKVRFEDLWGNLSGYVLEDSASSLIPSGNLELDVQIPDEEDPDNDEKNVWEIFWDELMDALSVISGYLDIFGNTTQESEEYFTSVYRTFTSDYNRRRR